MRFALVGSADKVEYSILEFWELQTDEAASSCFGYERRKHPRFLVNLPIEYRRTNDSIMRPGHTVNFSEEGLMVCVSKQMDIGEELEMKIYFCLPSRLITIAAMVKIEWEDTDPGDGYRIGLSFVNISLADKEKLKGFLNLYGDPNQAPSELESPPGSLLTPCKFPPAGHLGRAAGANPLKPTLFKRLLGRAMGAMGEFIRIIHSSLVQFRYKGRG